MEICNAYCAVFGSQGMVVTVLESLIVEAHAGPGFPSSQGNGELSLGVVEALSAGVTS